VLRVHDAHPSQLNSQQRTLAQHDMLPQHTVYRNELNCACFNITLARKKTQLPEDDLRIETCRGNFKCLYVRLYKCICWLIIKAILRNPRCNNKVYIHFIYLVTSLSFEKVSVIRILLLYTLVNSKYLIILCN